MINRSDSDDNDAKHRDRVSGTHRLTFTYADRQDIVEAGEAYYAPPGHTPAADPGTETIEFSPTEELHKTMAVAMKNAEALGAGAEAR